MKVSELKKLLDNVPDDTEVVVTSSDHEYRRAFANYTEAYTPNLRDIWECDENGDTNIKVLLVE